MKSFLQLNLAIAAIFFCILTVVSCRSDIADNQSVISGVSLDGKVSVEGAIGTKTGFTKSYSGYLSGVGPLSKEKSDYFIQWLSDNVEVGYVGSAVLDDGSLSILYLNKENKTSNLEIDFLKHLQQFSKPSKDN